MTAYFNPHTGKLETPEEMGERPADSETVLPVGIVSEVFREIWFETAKAVALEWYPPSGAPDSPPASSPSSGP